jgi:hypothetical protein
MCVVQTNDYGYAIAAWTESFGAGGRDFWLIRTDADGNMQWNKTYGGSAWDNLGWMIQTSDGGFALVGATTDFGADYFDGWLVKTDAYGNAQWNKTYGGASWEDASSIIQTADEGYVLAGYTSSYGAGGSDYWLVRTDSAGNMLWNRTYGGVGSDVAHSLIQTDDGGFALIGETRSFGAGIYDFWLVKTDSSGNMQWNQTYGGSEADSAYSIVQTVDGGYALIGSDSFGSLFVKTDGGGKMQWNMTYGEEVGDSLISIVKTNDNGYALAGQTYSGGLYYPDFWLVKTDSSGNAQWIQTSDSGFAIVGSTVSYGAGNWDVWLVRVDGTGTIPEFSPIFILPLLTMATIIAVIICKRENALSPWKKRGVVAR